MARSKTPGKYRKKCQSNRLKRKLSRTDEGQGSMLGLVESVDKRWKQAPPQEQREQDELNPTARRLL